MGLDGWKLLRLRYSLATQGPRPPHGRPEHKSRALRPGGVGYTRKIHRFGGSVLAILLIASVAHAADVEVRITRLTECRWKEMPSNEPPSSASPKVDASKAGPSAERGGVEFNFDIRDVQDYGNLAVQMELKGEGLRNVHGVHATTHKAVDDTGRDLRTKKETLLLPGLKESEWNKPIRTEGCYIEISLGPAVANGLLSILLDRPIAPFTSRTDSFYPDQQPSLELGTIRLQSPDRKATVLKELAGELELYDPTKDPNSVVTVSNIPSDGQLDVSHPTLKEAGVRIRVRRGEAEEAEEASLIPLDVFAFAFFSGKAAANPNRLEIARAIGQNILGMTFVGPLRSALNAFAPRHAGRPDCDDSKISVQLEDRRNRVTTIEFLDAAGAVLNCDSRAVNRHGWSASNRTTTYYLDKPLPRAGQMRIYVATPKSTTKTPFSFKDVPLP